MADSYNREQRRAKVIKDIRLPYWRICSELTEEMVSDEEIINFIEEKHATCNVHYYCEEIVWNYFDGISFNEMARRSMLHPQTIREQYRRQIYYIRRHFAYLKGLVKEEK